MKGCSAIVPSNTHTHKNKRWAQNTDDVGFHYGVAHGHMCSHIPHTTFFKHSLVLLDGCDGQFLAEEDSWEGWRSVLAGALVAVESNSWCAQCIVLCLMNKPWLTACLVRMSERVFLLFYCQTIFVCASSLSLPPAPPKSLCEHQVIALS